MQERGGGLHNTHQMAAGERARPLQRVPPREWGSRQPQRSKDEESKG